MMEGELFPLPHQIILVLLALEAFLGEEGELASVIAVEAV